MNSQHFAAAAFCAGLLSFSVSAAPEAAPTPADVNARLGLARSEVIRVHVADAPGFAQRPVVAIDGELFMLDLRPVSVRSAANWQ